jgi:phospholipase/carboxylesterase
MLEHIERVLGDEPRFTVIWLHGLGADGHDFVPIVPELALPRDAPVRFIFPHAPQQPVTVNGGMLMRAWYDIRAMEIAREVDEAGVDRSTASVRELLDQEVRRGIASNNILLAGFSQGGAIALHTGLLYEKPLLGILGLSTYLPVPDRLKAGAGTANRSTPIFLGHGDFDPVVPIRLGQGASTYLSDLGYAVEWHSYPMEHAVCLEEIRDVGAWMTGLFV